MQHYNNNQNNNQICLNNSQPISHVQNLYKLESLLVREFTEVLDLTTNTVFEHILSTLPVLNPDGSNLLQLQQFYSCQKLLNDGLNDDSEITYDELLPQLLYDIVPAICDQITGDDSDNNITSYCSTTTSSSSSSPFLLILNEYYQQCEQADNEVHYNHKEFSYQLLTDAPRQRLYTIQQQLYEQLISHYQQHGPNIINSILNVLATIQDLHYDDNNSINSLQHDDSSIENTTVHTSYKLHKYVQIIQLFTLQANIINGIYLSFGKLLDAIIKPYTSLISHSTTPYNQTSNSLMTNIQTKFYSINAEFILTKQNPYIIDLLQASIDQLYKSTIVTSYLTPIDQELGNNTTLTTTTSNNNNDGNTNNNNNNNNNNSNNQSNQANHISNAYGNTLHKDNVHSTIPNTSTQKYVISLQRSLHKQFYHTSSHRSTNHHHDSTTNALQAIHSTLFTLINIFKLIFGPAMLADYLNTTIIRHIIIADLQGLLNWIVKYDNGCCNNNNNNNNGNNNLSSFNTNFQYSFAGINNNNIDNIINLSPPYYAHSLYLLIMSYANLTILPFIRMVYSLPNTTPLFTSTKQQQQQQKNMKTHLFSPPSYSWPQTGQTHQQLGDLLYFIYNEINVSIYNTHLQNLELILANYPISLPAFVDIMYLQRLQLLTHIVPSTTMMLLHSTFEIGNSSFSSKTTTTTTTTTAKSSQFIPNQTKQNVQQHEHLLTQSLLPTISTPPQITFKEHNYIAQNYFYQTLLLRFVEVFLDVINQQKTHYIYKHNNTRHTNGVSEVNQFNINHNDIIDENDNNNNNTNDDNDVYNSSLLYLIKLYINLIRLAPLIDNQQQQYIILCITNILRLHIIKTNLNLNFLIIIQQLLFGNIVPTFSLDTITPPSILLNIVNINQNKTKIYPDIHQTSPSHYLYHEDELSCDPLVDMYQHQQLFKLPIERHYNNSNNNTEQSSITAGNNNNGGIQQNYIDYFLYHHHQSTSAKLHSPTIAKQYGITLSKLAYFDVILYRYQLLTMQLSIEQLVVYRDQMLLLNTTTQIAPNIMVLSIDDLLLMLKNNQPPSSSSSSSSSSITKDQQQINKQQQQHNNSLTTTTTKLNTNISHYQQHHYQQHALLSALTLSLPYSIQYKLHIPTLMKNTHITHFDLNNITHLKVLVCRLQATFDIGSNTKFNNPLPKRHHNNTNNTNAHALLLSSYEIPYDLQQLSTLFSHISFSSLPTNNTIINNGINQHDNNNDPPHHFRLPNYNNNAQFDGTHNTILSDVDIEGGVEPLDSLQWMPKEVVNIFSRFHFNHLLLQNQVVNANSSNTSGNQRGVGSSGLNITNLTTLLNASSVAQLTGRSGIGSIGTSSFITNNAAAAGLASLADGNDLTQLFATDGVFDLGSASGTTSNTPPLPLLNYFTMLGVLLQNIPFSLTSGGSGGGNSTGDNGGGNSNGSSSSSGGSTQYPAFCLTIAIFFAHYNLSTPVLLCNTMHYKLLMHLLQYFTPLQLAASVNIYHDVLKSAEIAYYFYLTKIAPIKMSLLQQQQHQHQQNQYNHNVLYHIGKRPETCDEWLLEEQLEEKHQFEIDFDSTNNNANNNKSPTQITKRLTRFYNNIHLLITTPSQWPDYYQYLGLFNSQQFMLHQIFDGFDKKSTITDNKNNNNNATNIAIADNNNNIIDLKNSQNTTILMDNSNNGVNDDINTTRNNNSTDKNNNTTAINMNTTTMTNGSIINNNNNNNTTNITISSTTMNNNITTTTTNNNNYWLDNTTTYNYNNTNNKKQQYNNNKYNSLELFNFNYLHLIYKINYLTIYQNNDILYPNGWFYYINTIYNNIGIKTNNITLSNPFNNPSLSLYLTNIWLNIYKCHPEMAYDIYTLYFKQLKSIKQQQTNNNSIDMMNDDDNNDNEANDNNDIIIYQNLIRLPKTIRLLYDEIMLHYKDFLRDYVLILCDHMGVVHLELEIVVKNNDNVIDNNINEKTHHQKENNKKKKETKIVDILCSPMAASILMCFANDIEYACDDYCINDDDSFNNRDDDDDTITTITKEYEPILFTVTDIAQIVGVNLNRTRNILMYWVNLGVLEYCGNDVFSSVE